MAHNLGIDHDCINNYCLYWIKDKYVGLKEYNGKQCDGYMDYQDATKGWSRCARRDFRNYVNSVPNFCLTPMYWVQMNRVIIACYLMTHEFICSFNDKVK